MAQFHFKTSNPEYASPFISMCLEKRKSGQTSIFQRSFFLFMIGGAGSQLSQRADPTSFHFCGLTKRLISWVQGGQASNERKKEKQNKFNDQDSEQMSFRSSAGIKLVTNSQGSNLSPLWLCDFSVACTWKTDDLL